jgi:hypothetical protein
METGYPKVKMPPVLLSHHLLLITVFSFIKTFIDDSFPQEFAVGNWRLPSLRF